MTNKLIELNEKDMCAVFGGKTSLLKGMEDTLCAASISAAISEGIGYACILSFPQPACAIVSAIIVPISFIAIPIIGSISEYFDKNQTVPT
jgi:hypothetical protein